MNALLLNKKNCLLIETNYTGSTSNEWNEKAFQPYNGTSWNDWTSGSLSSNLSSINLSWDSRYTSIFTSKD